MKYLIILVLAMAVDATILGGMTNKVASIGQNVRFVCLAHTQYVSWIFHPILASKELLLNEKPNQYGINVTQTIGMQHYHTLTISNVTFTDGGTYICKSNVHDSGSVGDLAIIGQATCYDSLVHREWVGTPDYFITNDVANVRPGRSRKYECAIDYRGRHFPQIILRAHRMYTSLQPHQKISRILVANASGYVRNSAEHRPVCEMRFDNINYKTHTGIWWSALNIPSIKRFECVP